MDFRTRLKAIKRSPHFHPNWYCARFPDVVALGMDPAEHYLRYGAALGRNPGKRFDAAFYLEENPDAAASGLNPLIHFALYGSADGRPTTLEGPVAAARRTVDAIRSKLLSLGFTDEPLAELRAHAEGTDPHLRAFAARELALWHLRSRTASGYRTALALIARARETAPDLDFRIRLATVELVCHHRLGQTAEGRAAYLRAGLHGEVGPDTTLAWVNFHPDAATRCLWINQVLARFALPPVALLPGADPDLPAYDRLTAGALPPVPASGAPRVTVLLAAYNAAGTLPTALRSLQAQTWSNLEILVLDDASPDDTAAVAERFAAADPRIRVVRMPQNGGAYVARNRGLDLATGDFVTIHDADDWSHPLKIEIQARLLAGEPDLFACTTEQARATPDLGFTRWTGRGGFIIRNVSSFMFRRPPMRAQLGYWDTVRFAADSELIRRAQRVFGRGTIRDLASGPLSFQRDSETSVVADEVLGMSGFYFGARKAYFDAQRAHHEAGASLRYSGDPADRPFPVPALMRPDRKRRLAGRDGAPRHFDLVIYGDFRIEGEALDRTLAEVRAQRAAGCRVGLVEVHDYGRPVPRGHRTSPRLWAEVDGEAVEMLVYGDHVTCGRVMHHGSDPDARWQRYLPKVDLIKESTAPNA